MHPDTQSLRLDDNTDIMIEDDDPFTAKLSFEVRTVSVSTNRN